jgi:hypothetical protein
MEDQTPVMMPPNVLVKTKALDACGLIFRMDCKGALSGTKAKFCARFFQPDARNAFQGFRCKHLAAKHA